MKPFPLSLRTVSALVVLSCVAAFPGYSAYSIVEEFKSHAITGDAGARNVDVLTDGVLVYAYNGGGASKEVKINGVTFEPINSAAGTGVRTYGSISCSASTGNFGNANPGSATGYVPADGPASEVLSDDYRELLQGGLGCSSMGAAVTLTLNNLQVGHTYLLQIWFNDSRDNKTNVTSSIRFGGQSGDEAFVLARNNGLDRHYLGSYATVKFTVDSDSQSFLLSNGNYVMFNGLQVRDITAIPEPSAMVLFSAAFLCPFYRRRRHQVL